ncbi:MAG: molybdopterin molybdotransferase MoeA [Chthoniobacterales bacterium]|nr:molybdopterin molybdotransferase MoeA [Chthoniobacterales bacterium]
MTTADEVWALLRAQVSPRPAAAVPLAEASGRTLRETVFTREDMPPFDRSAVDGFAVPMGDESGTFDIAGEIRAGDAPPGALSAGCASRIATGAWVPRDAEIVMLEDASVDGGRVSFTRRGRNHVRRRGEDARAGDELVRAGTLLSGGPIALLAGAGCTRPQVTRTIAAHHIATGNEIVDPSAAPRSGQIRDSNSALVCAWAQRRGMSVSQQRIGEDGAALRLALRDDCDLLLVSGGASVGRHDFTDSVLRQAGFEILVTKVNARPGKPLIVARRGEQWAFGLPGNPLSHFVCLHVFVDAALAAMNGSPEAPVLRRGQVTAAIAGHPRETWWPAGDGAAGLRPLRWASSGDLTALASADALVRVPVSGLAAGAQAGFIRSI